MRKLLLACLLGILCIPSFSQTTNNGSLAITDPTFNRPNEGAPPTTLSITGTDVHYKLITLEVAVPSLITVSSQSVWDNFLVLYSPAGFNPLLPLENALLAVDDNNGPSAGFTYSFSTPGTYTIVICSYKNGVTGSYNVTTSAPEPLPLKLLSFSATKTAANANLVKWSSSDESNLVSYQVEHSTTNNNFAEMKNGVVTPKNKPSINAYSFTDNVPAAGFNYYRLKIKETSGLIYYSPVAVVKNTAGGLSEIRVFPNPSVDVLKLQDKAMQNRKAIISVIDGAGQLLQHAQYTFDNEGILSMNVKALPAGKYFLRARVGDEEKAVVFIRN